MQPTTQKTKRESPFFRNYGATVQSSPARPSPLLSDASHERYHNVAVPAAQISANRHNQRRSLLSKLFTEEPLLLSPQQSARNPQVPTTAPGLSQSSSSACSLPDIYTSPSPSTKRPSPNPIIPKNSVLSRLERANSWSILTVIFLPALLILLCYLGTSTWKYSDQTIECSDTAVSQCFAYKNMLVFYNITNVHSLLRMSLSGSSMAGVRDVVVTVTLHTHTPPDRSVYTQTAEILSTLGQAYSNAGNVLDMQTDTYTIFSAGVYVHPFTYIDHDAYCSIPLPYIDMAFHASEFAPSTVGVYVSIPQTAQERTPIDVSLSTHTLSLPYIYTVLVLKVLVILACASASVTCAVRVWEKAEAGSRAAHDALPFAYACHLTPWIFILPEQFILCLGCVVYALYLALSLVPSPLEPLPPSPSPLTQHPPLLSAAPALLQVLCAYMLLLLSACYVDSLSAQGNEAEERAWKIRVRDMERAPTPALFPRTPDVHIPQPDEHPLQPTHPSSPPHTQYGVLEQVHPLFASYFTAFHPAAAGSLDHVAVKLMLLLLSVFVEGCAVVYEKGGLGGGKTEKRDIVLAVMGLAALTVRCVWGVYLLQLLQHTRTVLGCTRYLQSRFRQVAFRVLCWQLASSAAVSTSIFCFLVLRSTDHAPLVWESSTTGDVIMWQVLGVLWGYVCYWGGSVYVFPPTHTPSNLPVEATLFLPFLFVLTTCAILPPLGDQGDDAMTSPSYIPLRSHKSEKGQRSTPGQMKSNGGMFCLEQACFLLEASYQAYFPSHSRAQTAAAAVRPIQDDLYAVMQSRREDERNSTPDAALQDDSGSAFCSPSGPCLDLSRLGLSCAGQFSSSAFHTFGYIGLLSANAGLADRDDGGCSNDGEELVVSFRGSTLSNLSHDFMVAQVPWVPLQGGAKDKALDFFFEALSFIECHGDPFQQLSTRHQHTANPAIVYHNGNHAVNSSTVPPPLEVPNAMSSGPATPSTPSPMLSTDLPRSSYCCSSLTMPSVHVGFYQSYLSLRDAYLTKICQALYRHFYAEILHRGRVSESNMDDKSRNKITKPYRGPAIYLTGHSLGGAMACMAALDLQLNLPFIYKAFELYTQYQIGGSYAGVVKEPRHGMVYPTVQVYCYGTPRIGNSAWMRYFNENVPQCYRIQVDGDLVCMVPKIPLLYRHVGLMVLVDSQQQGNLVVQPSEVEGMFFRSVVGSISNHSLEIYRSCLEACFEPADYRDYLRREFGYMLKDSTFGRNGVPDWMAVV